ncbi:MAG: hypothetical protein IJC13_03650 [Clostridia bacterium]|nr:hypothetical protein [Clostridia bacterium]
MSRLTDIRKYLLTELDGLSKTVSAQAVRRHSATRKRFLPNTQFSSSVMSTATAGTTVRMRLSFPALRTVC